MEPWDALAPAAVLIDLPCQIPCQIAIQSNWVMAKFVPVRSDMSISRRAIKMACEGTHLYKDISFMIIYVFLGVYEMSSTP